MEGVRKEVEDVAALGRLPPEDSVDVEGVDQYETLFRRIRRPVTDDEARVLVKLFGDDDFFGLASSLMHLIETAPGWPLKDCLQNPNNEWVAKMRARALNGGYEV